MPDEKEKAKLTLSRPADRSLATFKKWINGVMQALKPGAEDTTTEEQWRDAHRRFWEKADNKGKK
jgi:hypothetical protein